MAAPTRHIKVLYHSPCPDGSFSALAAHLRFKGLPEFDVQFIPHTTFNKLQVDDKLFNKQTEVYLLDYIGPDQFSLELAPKVKRVTVLDHHKTAFELFDAIRQSNSLPANLEVHLEMERSGATIAWNYFNKERDLLAQALNKDTIAELYSYIEDTDLWRRKLPFAKEFSTGFGEKGIEHDINKNPSLFHQLQCLNAQELIEDGKEKVAQIQKIIDNTLDKSFTMYIGGKASETFGRCLAVFSDHPQLRSEMGNQLAEKSKKEGLRGIGAIIYEEELMDDKSKYKVSLRSIGDEDTSAISKHYGGGGHRNASSFVLEKTQFQLWLD